MSRSKWCSKCKETKSVEEFGKNRGRKDGLHNYCTECMEVIRKRKRTVLGRYKLIRGCDVCGYNMHPGALEFHHIDPTTKVFEVNNSTATFSRDRLHKEIDKCALLCANHHRMVEDGYTIEQLRQDEERTTTDAKV